MPFKAIFENAEREAQNNSNVNEGDYYGDDGLLYCGNCNTAKQVRVTFLGVEKTPFCMCKCEAEKAKAAEEQRKLAEMQLTISRNRNKAFPDIDPDTAHEDDVRNWTFQNDNLSHPELSNAAKKYVENFETFRQQGKGLLLYGSVGVGKSFMAGCIANALLDKGYSVLMTSFERIEKTAFGLSSGKQEYFDSLNRYSLLILDDLGVERKTDYMQEIVYSVVDSRSRANLPLIVTSNLTSQEFKNPVGISNQRIYSRILKMCHPIRVEGEDQRKRKAVESYAETKKILGL